ncbi:MAG: hypothetical protein OHK0039_43220 [Bacteroidia bacterium]
MDAFKVALFPFLSYGKARLAPTVSLTMRILILTGLFLVTTFLRAERVIGDLDFRSGEWTMIGVPMHNYKKLPIQEEMGTFITKDQSLMQEIQRNWDLHFTLDDNCDYHYALKFYKQGELERTIYLNLYCGYLTVEGLSYAFDPGEFERFRTRAQAVKWSRISFADMALLKKAIEVLDRSPEVYWYEDVKPYTYPGFCMLNVPNLPWNTDLDSLHQVVSQRVTQHTGSRDFYLQTYITLIQDDRLFARYMLNCDESLAQRLPGVYMPWRSHFLSRDSVHVVAIGIDEKGYRALMNQR